MEFRPSELFIKEYNGVKYLNIRNASNEALIQEAMDDGVREYEPEEEKLAED